MNPLGFLLGCVVGAAAVALRDTEIGRQARPAAKSMLKAALAAVHEAQVRKARAVEAAEDLIAEASAEVVAERLAKSKAAAEAKRQAAGEAVHEAQAYQADIMAAVTKLFAEANGQMTPERLSAVIAAALAKARETQDNGR